MKKIILTLLAASLLLGCGKDADRKIKLASSHVSIISQARVESIQLAASRKKSVVIYPFVNQTNRQDLNWLENGIVKMLISNLSLSRQLDLTPCRQVPGIMESMQLSPKMLMNETPARKVANTLDAEVYVRGRLINENDSLAIHLSLHDSRDSALLFERRRHSSNSNQIFSVMEQMARDLRQALETENTIGIEPHQTFVTTNSIKAYEQYTMAMEAHDKMMISKAREHLEKAVEIDSTFAAALAELGTLVAAQDHNRGLELLQKAVRFSQNAPERERLEIQAQYALARGDFYKAIQQFRTLAERYPEDPAIHYQLGTLHYGVTENRREAVERLEAVLALDPDHKLALNMLAYSHFYLGQTDWAYAVLDRYLEVAPNEPNPYDTYGEILMNEGMLDDAIDMFHTALEMDDEFTHSVQHLAVAHIANGQPAKARRRIRQLIRLDDSPKTRQTAYIYRANTELITGDKQGAIKWFQKAAEIEPQSLNALMSLHFLAPEDPMPLQKLHQWRDSIKDSTQSYNDILQVAVAGMYFDDDLNAYISMVRNLLDRLSDPLIRQSTLAILQNLQLCLGEFNADLSEKMISSTEYYTVFGANLPSWEEHWNLFYKNVKEAYADSVITRDYFKEMRQWANVNNYLQLQYAANVGLALCASLQNDTETMRRVMAREGAPLESDWSILGPFKVSHGIHQKFWPEKDSIETWVQNADAKGYWSESGDDCFDGFVNFHSIFDGELNSAGYAVLPIISPEARDCQFRFGVNGTLKAWLNDEQITTKFTYQNARLDEYIVPVRLQPGLNWVMVRLYMWHGHFGFYFRVTNSDGHGMSDLKFQLDSFTAAEDIK